jgi:hypothetical protein
LSYVLLFEGIFESTIPDQGILKSVVGPLRKPLGVPIDTSHICIKRRSQFRFAALDEDFKRYGCMFGNRRKATIPFAFGELEACAFDDQLAVVPIVSFINDPVADGVGGFAS